MPPADQPNQDQSTDQPIDEPVQPTRPPATDYSSMEESLIQEILKQPEHEPARLVYADWLEERGDARAEFLRKECKLFNLRFDHSDALEIKNRLIELNDELDQAWLKRIATQYDVWLKESWTQTLLAANVIRSLSQLFLQNIISLANASNMIGRAPCRVVKGLSLTQAEIANRTIFKAIGTFFGPSQFEILPSWRSLETDDKNNPNEPNENSATPKST